MDKISEIIGENIALLRKTNNMTQQQLAERINYTNKAVSRWEKGECLPSIDTLSEICDFFGVEFEFLIKKNEKVEKQVKSQMGMNKIAVAMLTVLSMLTIATIVFVYIKLFYGFNYWQAFVWAAPVSFISIYLLSRKWWGWIVSLICFSGFIWTFLLCLFLTFIDYGIWPIFILGAPVQVIAVLLTYIREEKNSKK